MAFENSARTQLLRFAAVGGTGTAVNLAVFTACLSLLHLGPNACAVAAFAVAVTWNYSLNRVWTFRRSGAAPVGWAAGWWRYVLVNLMGLGVNLAALNTVVALYGKPYSLHGQALGVACGVLFNFQLARTRVFNRA